MQKSDAFPKSNPSNMVPPTGGPSLPSRASLVLGDHLVVLSLHLQMTGDRHIRSPRGHPVLPALHLQLHLVPEPSPSQQLQKACISRQPSSLRSPCFHPRPLGCIPGSGIVWSKSERILRREFSKPVPLDSPPLLNHQGSGIVVSCSHKAVMSLSQPYDIKAYHSFDELGLLPVTDS